MPPEALLSGTEIAALHETLDAENRHANALLGVFQRFGLAPPANRRAGKAPRFASLHKACVASVPGAIDNAAIDDRARQSPRRGDMFSVHEALRSASHDRHLPAFQRCIERGNCK